MMDLEHHPPHDEEGWLVSYADLVTILMGFFVIMYSMSSPDEAQLQKFGEQISSTLGKADLGSSPLIATPDMQRTLKIEDAYRRMLRIAGLNGEPEAIVSQLKKVEADESVRRAMAEQFQDVPVGGAVSTLNPKDGKFIGPKEAITSFTLPERMLFAPGTNILQPEAIAAIEKIALVIGSAESTKVEIVGHTDSTLPGANAPFANNWSLSSARAGSVAEVLIRGGVNTSQVNVRGVADSQPINKGNSAADRAKNRRVEIRVLQRH